MRIISQNNSSVTSRFLVILVILLSGLTSTPTLQAQDENISKRLSGFDQYMEKILKDSKCRGCRGGYRRQGQTRIRQGLWLP